MTDEDTLAVELLRSHVVRLLRIGEYTGLHVIDVHPDGERLIGGNFVLIGRAGKLARGHVSLWDDVAQRDRVARSSSNLLAIGDRLSRAEVDEVVLRRSRGNLTCNGRVLTIVLQSSCHQV